MLTLFLSFEIKKIGKFFKTRATAKLITSFLFFVVFFVIALGIYHFFTFGIRYINLTIENDIRPPLLLFLYEIFLAMLFCLVVFSSLITSIFSLFKKGIYNAWLISTPSYKVLPTLTLIKSIFASAGPFLVMFLPAIFAFCSVYHISIIGILLLFTATILFLTLTCTLTLLSVLIIARVSQLIYKYIFHVTFSLKSLLLLIFGFLFLLFTTMWSHVRTIDLITLFKANNADTFASSAEIGSHFYGLPSHFFALLLASLQREDISSSLLYVAPLLFGCLITVIIFLKFSKVFYPIWLAFQEGQITITNKKEKISVHFTGSSTLALLKKEAIISARNTKGLLWFLFLFLIWITQIGMHLIVNTNIHRYGADLSKNNIELHLLQFIIIIYFISAFTLRFVFPAFSMEKKVTWILASAPINFKKIFIAKYCFYSIFFVFLSLFMSFVSEKILEVSFIHSTLTSALISLSTLCIVTFGLILGALFPNLETDDPEIISTSIPGLLFTAVSLLFGAFSASILYLFLSKHILSPAIFFTLVSFITLYISVKTICKKRITFY